MSTLGERIRAVRKAQKPKMNQQAFGGTLGASRDMIKTYELGQVVPNKTFRALLCRTYHINSLWLETGEGEMIAAEASAPCDTAQYQQNTPTNPLSRDLTSSPFGPSSNFFNSLRKHGSSFSG